MSKRVRASNGRYIAGPEERARLTSFAQEYCDLVGIPFNVIVSSNRQRELVFHRVILSKLLRGYFETTFELAGKILNRDHATIMHGVKSFDKLEGLYPEYNRAYSIGLSLAMRYKEGLGNNTKDLMAILMKSNSELRKKLKEESRNVKDLNQTIKMLKVRIENLKKHEEII